MKILFLFWIMLFFPESVLAVDGIVGEVVKYEESAFGLEATVFDDAPPVVVDIAIVLNQNSDYKEKLKTLPCVVFDVRLDQLVGDTRILGLGLGDTIENLRVICCEDAKNMQATLNERYIRILNRRLFFGGGLV